MSGSVILICALFQEAKPYIQFFHLKKRPDIHPFQVFKNTEKKIILILSGSGKMKAATATTFILQNIPDPKALINIGICGARDEKIGDVFQVSKIVDISSQRTFFPDIVRKNFPLKPIYTLDIPDEEQKYPDLVDMEASGVFQAAEFFLAPHQLYFYKIVSDDCSAKKIDKNLVQKILEDCVEKIAEKFARIPVSEKFSFLPEEESFIEAFFQKKYCSVTEKIQWRKKFWNAKIKNIPFSDIS